MSDRTQRAATSHTRFMQAVNEELTKFECREREFRHKDREERAKRLQMPVEKYNAEDRCMARQSNPMRSMRYSNSSPKS
jgi:hypothetical protein